MTQPFIIGGGGWGTALGMVLAEKAPKVILWEHDTAYAAEVQATRESPRYLKGVKLPAQLEFRSTFAGLELAELIVLSVPSRFIRSVCEQALPLLKPGALLVVATKGIEPGTLLTMSQVAADVAVKAGLPKLRIASLTGPSHAEEVGRKLATSVVTAADDPADARAARDAFNVGWFRVYLSDDHLGVELGGALKNVVALAAGISDGLGLGDNAKAALITRGLAEMTRLGVSLGAKASTFSGLAGLGDLVVTCMSQHSRNRGVGERLGKGERWSEISKTMIQAVEGAVTCESAYALAKRQGIEMPITEQVYEVLYHDKPAKAGLADLLAREAKGEAN